MPDSNNNLSNNMGMPYGESIIRSMRILISRLSPSRSHTAGLDQLWAEKSVEIVTTCSVDDFVLACGMGFTVARHTIPKRFLDARFILFISRQPEGHSNGSIDHRNGER